MKMNESQEAIAIKRPYRSPVCRSATPICGTVFLACSNPALPFECVNFTNCCLPAGSNETDCDNSC
jgi:hypothetical protein